MAYSSYSPFKPIRSFTSSKSMGGVNQAPLTSPSLYLPRFVIKTCISINIHILFIKNSHKKSSSVLSADTQNRLVNPFRTTVWINICLQNIRKPLIFHKQTLQLSPYDSVK